MAYFTYGSYNFEITAMDSALREKLTQLNTKCEILAKSGKYNECIEIMEEIISIKKELYGMDHPEF